MANVVRFIGLKFLSLWVLRFLGIERTWLTCNFPFKDCKINLLIYQVQMLVVFKVCLFLLLTLILVLAFSLIWLTLKYFQITNKFCN